MRRRPVKRSQSSCVSAGAERRSEIVASIGKDRNGRKRILYVAEDGSRKTIRMGKCSMRQAEQFKTKLENLIGGRYSGGLDDDTSRWLAALPDDIYAKLSSVGLVEERASLRLGEFLDSYIKGRVDVKPGTTVHMGQTRRNLIAYFGADKALREINQGDADQWRLHLVGQGLSDNTVRRRCGLAKQFFKAAMRRKLVAENPFEELKSSVQGNRAKEYFISPQEAEAVLEACPDSQWRLVFALCRYGGLRCPSEILALTWSDIDWDRGRVLVHSCKTEHVGKDSRQIPLFPELVPYLQEVFEQAAEGTQHVITRYRRRNTNLRTQLHKIIRRAGLKPWPKTFQNLRSTRQTELAERWPGHVVCAWMGNTKKVADAHYLQVTQEHFEQAAQCAQIPAQCAQNPAQYTSAHPRKATQANRTGAIENADLPVCASAHRALQNTGMGRAGFEPA